MRKLWLAAVAAATLAGCSTEADVDKPSEPERFDMRVNVQVAPNFVVGVDGGGCAGEGRGGGLREGAYVTVSDAVGAKVGAGNLERGTINSDRSCTLTATVPVAVGTDFYDVEVGSYGAVTRSAEQAQSEGVGIGFGY